MTDEIVKFEIGKFYKLEISDSFQTVVVPAMCIRHTKRKATFKFLFRHRDGHLSYAFRDRWIRVVPYCKGSTEGQTEQAYVADYWFQHPSCAISVADKPKNWEEAEPCA